MLAKLSVAKINSIRTRFDVANLIVLAQINSKFYYDRKY